MVRAYIEDGIHERVLKYAENMGKKVHTKAGLSMVYSQLISNLLDEKGHVKDRLVLTEGQMKIIQEIAAGMEESPEKIVQELFNYALMIYTTHISLREVIVRASPLMMDDLITHNKEVAKEILQGLKLLRQKDN